MVEQLVADNLSWLRVKACRFCVRCDDAEDLVSETVEKILTSRERFDLNMHFRPWALTIMRNTYISLYNRKKCMPLNQFINETYSAPCRSDYEVSLREIFSIIRECARRSVAIECVLMYAKGYSYDEISQILHIPKGTVMSRICNGRKLLRVELLLK